MNIESETKEAREIAEILQGIPKDRKKDLHNGLVIAGIILSNQEDVTDNIKAG